MRYFEALGLDPRLTLDAADLQKRFYERSRQWHPDRFSTKSPAEQAKSLEMTAELNDAFRTLRDTVARAEYVLSENGLEASTQRGKDVPADLLEEVLELNMALEEADQDQITRSLAQFEQMLASVDAQLTAQFAAWDGSPSADTLQPVRSSLNRRKYISNLVRDARKALDAPPEPLDAPSKALES
ncbi:MAG: Fe-S protein assembly co-chaperone HscB [Acidobacteriota bacterium]